MLKSGAIHLSVAIVAFTTTESHTLPSLVRVASPKNLEHIEALSVDVRVELSGAARRETFRAWLNLRDITALFNSTPMGLVARVDSTNGLRVGERGDPPLKQGNLLTVSVLGNRRLPDFDSAVFFVQRPPILVPHLVGRTSEDAVATLMAAGLAPGAVTEEPRASIRTGIVIRQDPPAGSELNPGSAVEFTRVAEPPPDAPIPNAWAGVWSLELIYRDAETGVIDTVVEVTDAICPEDPLGIAALEANAATNPSAGPADCSGTATDQHIDAACTGRVTVSLCDIEASAAFEMELAVDTMSGSGQWTLGDVCALPLPTTGQTIEIRGRRTGPDPGISCDGPRSSLLQKFLKHSLLPLLGNQI
jgi:hypothetical protein